MTAVKIGIASRAAVNARAKAAFRGKKQGALITFSSYGVMHRVLTPNRLTMLLAMMDSDGAIGVRELARKVKRDVKSVHGDVAALLKAGVLDKADDGRLSFPFDTVHVDFTVKAA